MAKFSQKVNGKEVGNAEVYAEPHTGAKSGVDIRNNGYDGGKRYTAEDVCMSVGNIRSKPYKEAKSDGIVTRGNGAATKGITARGPMA